jgi:ribosomal protein S18 acetylase RimI-like enzyme
MAGESEGKTMTRVAYAAARARFDRKENPIPPTGGTFTAYHGTSKRLKRLDPAKGAFHVVWFSGDRETIEQGESGAESAAYILELRVTMRRPAGWQEYDQLVLDELVSRGYDGAILPRGDSFDGFVFDASQIEIVGTTVRGAPPKRRPNPTDPIGRIVSVSSRDNGHTHTVWIPSGDLKHPRARAYQTSRDFDHHHFVELSPQSERVLASNQPVKVTCTYAKGHTHDFEIDPRGKTAPLPALPPRQRSRRGNPAPELLFRHELLSTFHNQDNMSLTAYAPARAGVAGGPVGRIDYAMYHGQPHVQMLHVHEAHRRKGIAEALARDLQREYPDTEIDWGMLTPAGAAFLAQLPRHYVLAGGKYAALAKRVQELRQRSAQLETQWNDYYKRGAPVPAEAEQLQAEDEAITSALEEATRALGGTPAGKWLVDLDPP